MPSPSRHAPIALPTVLAGIAFLAFASVSSLARASNSDSPSAPPTGASDLSPGATTPPSDPARRSPPESEPQQSPITCALGAIGNVPQADANTTLDLLCRELAEQRSALGVYELKFGTLGSRTLLSVVDRSRGIYRGVFIQSIDEVPTAVTRLVDAITRNTSLDETRTVDNVVTGDDPATRKTRAVSPGAYLGVVGAIPLGERFSASGGVDVGVRFRVRRWSLGSHGRAAGIGSSNSKLMLLSLDVGGRYSFSDAEFAPFVGGGALLASYGVRRAADRLPDASGSGLGVFAEVGVELMRSSRIGFTGSIRAEFPFFRQEVLGSGALSALTSGELDVYVVPLTINAGFGFR